MHLDELLYMWTMHYMYIIKDSLLEIVYLEKGWNKKKYVLYPSFYLRCTTRWTTIILFVQVHPDPNVKKIPSWSGQTSWHITNTTAELNHHRQWSQCELKLWSLLVRSILSCRTNNFFSIQPAKQCAAHMKYLCKPWERSLKIPVWKLEFFEEWLKQEIKNKKLKKYTQSLSSFFTKVIILGRTMFF